MGIEPTLAAWEAAVLPLNYTRIRDQFMPAKPGLATRGRSNGPPRREVQNPPLIVANTVACLPPFWPTVRLLPRLASRPNSRVRAPKVTVP